MDERPRGPRDPMSRVAVRQLLWLGAVGTAGFIALMAALAWASPPAASTRGLGGRRRHGPWRTSGSRP